MTERLHFHFSLSCIGGGNGNPLQCSCLENPRDGGAWWAAVYGVAQSWTRLKRLSSSSSSIPNTYVGAWHNKYLMNEGVAQYPRGGDETIKKKTSRGLSQILASAILVLELTGFRKEIDFLYFKGRGTICVCCRYKCLSPR